jgi:hypothetical protein
VNTTLATTVTVAVGADTLTNLTITGNQIGGNEHQLMTPRPVGSAIELYIYVTAAEADRIAAAFTAIAEQLHAAESAAEHEARLARAFGEDVAA